jgi:hypothetical protein
VVATLVFLHGVGDGEPASAWQAALNQSLANLDRPAVPLGAVKAPRYDDILDTDGMSAKVPSKTYGVDDDTAARLDFERRQADLFQRLGVAGGVDSVGFGVVPHIAMTGAQHAGLKTPNALIKQVKRYIGSEKLRGAVLRRILTSLPTEGDIVLVGHSLGSVIAIDLLDRLPTAIHVSRFVTLGSPANIDALHNGSERLLTRFPYARVDDWTNFFGHRDPITGGRGLAGIFPGAQDFPVDIGLAHAAKSYFSKPFIAEIVGEKVSGRPPVVRGSNATQRVLPISKEQVNVLLGLAFGHALSTHIESHDVAERYRSALSVVQRGVLAQLEAKAEASDRKVPDDITSMGPGRPPKALQHIGMTDAVLRLAALSESNIVAPYEIEVGKAHRAALQDTAGQLGFTPNVGKRVHDALTEVREHTGRRGVPWGRVLTGAAGLALIAAGPVGLMAAVPASAFGAAAITGGLAAFGPGGMVGGMALMGGLASAGAAVATSAATGTHSATSPTDQAGALLVRVAAQRALQMLDLPHDPEIWSAVINVETSLSSQIARLRPFSDKAAPGLVERERALTLVVSLIDYMAARGIGPKTSDTEKEVR